MRSGLAICFLLWLILVLGCGDGNRNQQVSATATPSPSPTVEITPSPTPDTAKEIEAFKTIIKAADKNNTFVEDARQGSNPDTLNIIVANRWHYELYQMRLQTAQAFLKVWVAIHSPQDPDKARISLRDKMDNEVGGSGVLGSIWVQEN